mmetsp:Transcript_20493/g.57008  ORF Transcript_20493/g.57008 Transcript_20493/m.57008 type:complete len:127 (+) Transcript_20493:1144-1524(+)
MYYILLVLYSLYDGRYGRIVFHTASTQAPTYAHGHTDAGADQRRCTWYRYVGVMERASLFTTQNGGVSRARVSQSFILPRVRQSSKSSLMCTISYSVGIVDDERITSAMKKLDQPLVAPKCSHCLS